MNAFYDRPCAGYGLTSYRYRGGLGWIMIGATDVDDALNEANRSLSVKGADVSRLEVWDGKQYIPVKGGA